MSATIPTADDVRQIVREELERLLGGPAVMTTEQAAVYAGVSAKTIRNWVGEGLRVEKKGRRLVIRREDLDSFRTGRPTDSIVASLRRAG